MSSATKSVDHQPKAPESRPRRAAGRDSRKCGDCRACCTVMAVPDMTPPKPMSERCSNLCSTGCRIYAERPPTCRDFECLWLQGAMPRELRPDKVGIVFVTGQTAAGQSVMGHIDKRHPYAWRRTIPTLRLLAQRGIPVIVGTDGKAETIFRPGSGHMETRKEPTP